MAGIAVGQTAGRPAAPPGSVMIACGRIDLTATLDGGQAFRWRREGDAYRGVIGDRALHLAPAPGGVRLTAADGRDVEALAPRVRCYLGFGREFDRFHERFASDPRLRSALENWPGLRILRQDPWECLVSFIASATSNIPRIKLNVGAIAAAFGDRVGPGERDYRFPAPDAVAAAGEARLRELGLGFRAQYIAAAAQKVAQGDLFLESLRELPFLAARDALMSLAGVGEKIADCVLAFSLDQSEAFPVDRWTRRALEEWCGMPSSLSNSKAAHWARARFGPDAAYVQQYLFHRQRASGSQRPEP